MMRQFITGLGLLVSIACLGGLVAAPHLIQYQGYIAEGGIAYEGAGDIKLALVNSDGTTTYWSNDGTSTAGSEPTADVDVTVNSGVFSITLGDTSLTGMDALPATVFENDAVYLRIWFRSGLNSFELLTPDQRITSVAYAMTAESVPDGAITADKIATDAVTTDKIEDGAVTADKLASGLGGGLSSLPAGTMLLSTNESDTALINAGFVNIAVSSAFDGKIENFYHDSAQPNVAYVYASSQSYDEFPRNASLGNGKLFVWTVNYVGSVSTGLYDIASDVWSSVSTINNPTWQIYESIGPVWTGSEFIVWSGANPEQNPQPFYTDEGRRYNPQTNTWATMSTTNAPAGRNRFASTWTGTEMLVWGGSTNGGTNDHTGGRYNPQTNTWTTISTTNAPLFHNDTTSNDMRYVISLWTGTEWILWQSWYTMGARYNPTTDTWTTMSTTNAPLKGQVHNKGAVWTGTDMYTYDNGQLIKYTPATDTWTSIDGAYAQRIMRWDGTVIRFPSGSTYNPATDTWVNINSSLAPTTAVVDYINGKWLYFTNTNSATYYYTPAPEQYIYLKQ